MVTTQDSDVHQPGRSQPTAKSRIGLIVATSLAAGRRSVELLVIGRTEVDLRTVTDKAMKTAAIRRVAPADRTSEALDIIMETVCQAAAHVADIDLHTVDIDAAGQAAQTLASPLLRLTQLRQSLLMHRPRR